jgi:hypothetical protein
MAKQKNIIQAIVDERVSQLVTPQSENGLSAYELALQEGFSGTLQQWLDSLHGRDGMDGSDATVTQQAVEAVLTGEISSHSHAGGSGGLTQAQILNLL